MGRKIVQIAVTQVPDEEASIVALADDGSVWVGFEHYIANGVPAEFRWDRLPNLPDNLSNLSKVR